MGFDFSKIENVFIFGAGVSAGRGIPVGKDLMTDIFRIYNIPNRQPNDEGPAHEPNYKKVMEYCTALYNLGANINLEDIKSFKNVIANNPIDFEDYLSRVYLWHQSEIFRSDRPSPDALVEPNLMRLLYWYFWHHIRNWTNKNEFPGQPDNEYIEKYQKKIDSKSVILTTNYDLIFETNNPVDWKVAYKPEMIQNGQVLYLKLHGSINWIARWSLPKMIQLKTDRTGQYPTYENREVDSYPDFILDTQNGNNIKIIHDYFTVVPSLKVVIMPPVLYKGLNSEDAVLNLMLKEVWGNAKKCLGHVKKRIIFAGISLRETDIMLQLLMKLHIKSGTKIYLNSLPDEGKAKEEHMVFKRFNRLFNLDINNYYDCTFQEFVNAHLDGILADQGVV